MNKWPARIIYGLLLLCALGWFLATLLPAYWAAHGQPLWAIIGHQCFAPFCHQMPARSFYLWGYPLAVCARCSGIYGGIIFGLISYPCVRACTREDLPARKFLLLALAPTAADFLSGYCNIISNTHLSRSVTGFIAGCGLAYYLMPAAISLTRECVRAWPSAARAVKEFFLWKHQAR